MRNISLSTCTVKGKNAYQITAKNIEGNVLATAKYSATNALRSVVNHILAEEEEYLLNEYDLASMDELVEEEADPWDLATWKKMTRLLENIESQEDSFNNGTVLHWIEADQEGTGAGTEIVNHLKETSDCIVLFPITEAESYWEKQGFKELVNGYMYFTNNEIIENMLEESSPEPVLGISA